MAYKRTPSAGGGSGGGDVTSVASRTGDVVLTKTDVGLANVDNTADTAKPVSTAQAAADALALAKASNLSDLANAGTARTNLGLGTAAVISSTAGGDLTGTLPSPTLAAIGSATGPSGSATVVPVVTIDTKGRVTALTTATIAIPESAVTSLVSDLAAKAALASPTFTGTPAAPTAAQGTNTTQVATTAHVQTEVALKVSTAQSVNAQTGTTYTLVAADAGKLVTLSNASAVTLTLPQDSDATIAIGTYVDLLTLGAGQVTVVAGTGATLRTSGLTAKSRAQYARFGVQKVSANTWSLYGDLAAS